MRSDVRTRGIPTPREERFAESGNASNTRARRSWWFPLTLRFVLMLALATTSEPILDAQQVRPTEAQLKAAFLFNFGKYVTWPAIAGETFSICVLGQDPFGSTLDAIVSGETLAGKPATVRRIRAAEEASSCQIVFISSSEEAHLQATLVTLARSSSALTVSDLPAFVHQGGMIQFVEEGKRVRFVVNLAAARRAGLVLSSELLKVAKVVDNADRRGAM
jgi:hypothetical protein